MSEVLKFGPGGYNYVKGVFQYSAGVSAARGFRLERVRFRTPMPLAEGFRRIEQYLRDVNRPVSSFCACELRSPAPFTEEGFRAFNLIYVGTLQRWGIYDGRANPVARSNVCPEMAGPGEPAFYAFTHTVEVSGAPPSFVIAGSAESPEGSRGGYQQGLVAPGDTSPEGMRAKATWVLGEMERRMKALGFGWGDVTATQAYTVHDMHPFMAEEMVARGAVRGGLTWHYSRPPVIGLEFEMDCRAVQVERVI